MATNFKVFRYQNSSNFHLRRRGVIISTTYTNRPYGTGNNAPQVAPGPEQNLKTGSVAMLSGSGSSDADGDMLTYHWAFTRIPNGCDEALADELNN